MVEQVLPKHQVEGSIPFSRSKEKDDEDKRRKTMKIIGRTWFTPTLERRGIGIVLVEFTPEEMQAFGRTEPVNAFIGLARETSFACYEIEDMERIIKDGARFSVEAAKLAIGGL